MRLARWLGQAIHARIEFVKKFRHRSPLRLAIRQRVHVGAKGLAARQRPHIPANVLACAEHAMNSPYRL